MSVRLAVLVACCAVVGIVLGFSLTQIAQSGSSKRMVPTEAPAQSLSATTGVRMTVLPANEKYPLAIVVYTFLDTWGRLCTAVQSGSHGDVQVDCD